VLIASIIASGTLNHYHTDSSAADATAAATATDTAAPTATAAPAPSSRQPAVGGDAAGPRPPTAAPAPAPAQGQLPSSRRRVQADLQALTSRFIWGYTGTAEQYFGACGWRVAAVPSWREAAQGWGLVPEAPVVPRPEVRGVELLVAELAGQATAAAGC
jgi:hypothetical protein